MLDEVFPSGDQDSPLRLSNRLGIANGLRLLREIPVCLLNELLVPIIMHDKELRARRRIIPVAQPPERRRTGRQPLNIVARARRLLRSWQLAGNNPYQEADS